MGCPIPTTIFTGSSYSGWNRASHDAYFSRNEKNIMSLKDFRMSSLRDKIEGVTNEEIAKKTAELKKDIKKKAVKKVGKLGKKK